MALGAGVGGVGHDHEPLWIDQQHGVGDFSQYGGRGGQQHQVGLACVQGEQGWIVGLVGQHGAAQAAHVLVEGDVDAAHFV
jgi:hypothetical protein